MNPEGTPDNMVPGNHNSATNVVAETTGQARLTLERQAAFLEGFVRLGTVKKGAEVADITRQAVDYWCQNDSHGFVERYASARADRRDFAEDKYILHPLDNPKGNYGTDLLRIAYMNRIDPEHWRPNVKIQLEVPNEVIQQLRALQELASKGAQLPAPKTVEGKAEVLPWE